MAVSNSLVARKQVKSPFTAYLAKDAVKKQINDVIGGANGQRFISAIVSAVNVNPSLGECTNPSILSAALLGESLKLSPSPQLGHYYMVPFDDKERGKVATFQLGYKGYIQLAIRSGNYKKINVMEIKDGELVSYDPFNEEIVLQPIQDVDEREQTETIGYYAMFEYINGFKKVIYWSKKQMLQHADKYSPAFSQSAYEKLQNGEIPNNEMWKYSSFWYKDFDGMAKKTLIRQLIGKWGVMSAEMTQAMELDNNSLNVEKNGFVTVEADENYDTDVKTVDDTDNDTEDDTEEVNFDEV